MHIDILAVSDYDGSNKDKEGYFSVIAKVPYEMFLELSKMEGIHEYYGYIFNDKYAPRLTEIEDIEIHVYGLRSILETEKFTDGRADFCFTDLTIYVHPQAREKFESISRPHHGNWIARMNFHTVTRQVEGKEIHYLDYITLSSPDEE